MNSISTHRQLLENKKGQKFQVEKTIAENTITLKELTRDLHRHEEARVIIREVGLKTQEQLSFHISDITSLALETVFNDPYELKVDFIQRRNKTECDLLFERGGMKIKPLTASGIGAVDVASFALRIAAWTMMNPRSRNTIILDEPFHFLSNDNQERASMMIKELSKKLGLQFIIVTHNEILASYADRTFTVNKRKKITKIIQS
jgi:chromosome segregation ATPase